MRRLSKKIALALCFAVAGQFLIIATPLAITVCVGLLACGVWLLEDL